MKLNDVPQDRGMITGQNHEICYAVDEDGRYVLAPSSGWGPKNLANSQAWDLLKEEIEAVLKRVRNGELSPLAFHMANNQMNVGLLAKYARFSRWRVWLHLRPRGFNRLTPAMLERYAEVFEIDVAALKSVPQSDGQSAR
jgi:hypothetical protein